MFRGSMEFSPFVRGPQTAALSLPVPLPSTVAGATATLVLDLSLGRYEVSNDWVEQIRTVLQFKDESRLRGPYIYTEDGKIYLAYGSGLTDFDSMVKGLGKNKYVEDLLKVLLPKRIEHVGVALERPKKAAKEGFLYSAEMVDYSSITTEQAIYIVVDALNVPLINELRSQKYTIRFGGEGKLSQMSVRDEPILTKRVESQLEEAGQDISAHLYLATHALFRSQPKLITPEQIAHGVYISPSFLKQIEGTIREFAPKANIDYVLGDLKPLGGGYSLAREARKPMYMALVPGAVIRLSNVSRSDLSNLYMEGISQVGSDMGYGTVIPVPITR